MKIYVNYYSDTYNSDIEILYFLSHIFNKLTTNYDEINMMIIYNEFTIT